MSASYLRLFRLAVGVLWGSCTFAHADPARVQWLRAEIARHDELYFKKAAPEISDAEYDRLKRELLALEQTPTPGLIGDDRTGERPTRKHREPMLSLEKAYTEAELNAWLVRAHKALGEDNASVDWTLEPKLDGVAINLTYEQGRLVSAVTRGDGREGDEVTANVLMIAGLPRVLPSGAPDVVEVRGEIFVDHATFTRLNAERAEAGDEPWAHPRNVAAGTIKSHDADETARRGLRVACYGIGAWAGATLAPETQASLFALFETWGLPVVANTRVVRTEEVASAVAAFGRDRRELGYPVDGVVLKLNSLAARRALGASDEAPRWAVAYKFAPERVSTRLRAITLQVGRTGAITPVADLEPVKVGGTTVSRATLHNAEEIARRDLRVDDWVFVERAGEVIPAITGVDLARRDAAARPFVFPNDCGACATPLVRDGAAHRCPNARCEAQVRKRIEFFASRSGVGINGLGPALVGKLVESGRVTSVADLYRLTADDGVPAKVLAEIEKSRRAELGRIIGALGLPGIGKKGAEELASRFGRLSALADSDVVDAESRELIRALVAAGVNS